CDKPAVSNGWLFKCEARLERCEPGHARVTAGREPHGAGPARGSAPSDDDDAPQGKGKQSDGVLISEASDEDIAGLTPEQIRNAVWFELQPDSYQRRLIANEDWRALAETWSPEQRRVIKKLGLDREPGDDDE